MRLLNQNNEDNYLDKEIKIALTRKELLIVFEIISNTSGELCKKFLICGRPFTYNIEFSSIELSDILYKMYKATYPIMRSELSEIIVKETNE